MYNFTFETGGVARAHHCIIPLPQWVHQLQHQGGERGASSQDNEEEEEEQHDDNDEEEVADYDGDDDNDGIPCNGVGNFLCMVPPTSQPSQNILRIKFAEFFGI